jgi:hypothetical protein
MIKIYGNIKFSGKISITPNAPSTPELTEIESIYSSLIGPFASEDNSISNEDSLILWSSTNNYFFEL